MYDSSKATQFKNLFLVAAAFAFAACGSDATGPGTGGGGSEGGDGDGGGTEFPDIPPAAQIFTDDIDSENGGVGEANYTGWANWTVVEGCVDLHGPGDKDPLPGNGVYMDLDGTCQEAATIETKNTFNLEVGDYTLEFLIAGNNQVAEVDTLDVAVGGAMSDRIILPWDQGLMLMELDFAVSSASSGKIVLAHHGGDDQGILIDAVRLRRN